MNPEEELEKLQAEWKEYVLNLSKEEQQLIQEDIDDAYEQALEIIKGWGRDGST